MNILKNNMKNKKIDPIIRCLYSFDSLSTNSNDLNSGYRNKAYIQLLKCIKENGLKYEIIPIKDFRQILGLANSNLERWNEIDPNTVFSFLIKELNKELELNRPTAEIPLNNVFLIKSGLDKEEIWLN